MTTQQLARIPELFDQALDLDPAARETFLRGACADDEEVYREVKSLLNESANSTDFLQHSALSLATRAMAEELTPLRPGTRLGRYEILRELGHGGMGEVFQARDDIGLQVAIKVLPDYFAQDAERVSRFESEARKMASLKHPNIAGIHGREVTGGWRFLVLEYVEGQTLERRLEQGPLPVREALSVFAQIADALAATHGKDIAHRDLKPSNIMLTPSGQVKLLDFGIAKHFHQHEPTTQPLKLTSEMSTLTQSLTMPGFTPGTLPYMSPEQRSGGKTDLATDLWAFGVVFYEALTGKNPFRRDTREETTTAIVSFTPNWNLLPRETPQGVRNLLQRCLLKDPHERLRDAGQAKALLEAARKGMDGGFDLRGWFAQWQKYFSRRMVISFASVAMALTGVFIWRDYQKKVLHLNIVPPATAACATLDAQQLRTRFNQLARVEASVAAAPSQDAQLNVSLTPQCEAGKTLVKLVNPQGLTVFAQFVANPDEAMKRLTGVLQASVTRLGTKLSASQAQMNLAASALPNLTEAEERLLDLDQWDNQELLDAAITLVEKKIAEHSDSASLQAALSRAYLYKFKLTHDLTDKQKAYAAYTKALTFDPEAPDALLAAGDYQLDSGATDAARSYEAVLQHRPNDAQAWLGLGRAYELANQLDQAEEAYAKAVIFRPQYWGGYHELGAFYTQIGNFELAHEFLSSATKLGDNPTVQNTLGALYFYQNDLKNAVAAYETAISRTPNADSYLGLGLIRSAAGAYDEAADYFRLAKEKRPNVPRAWGYYGEALLASSAQPEKAQEALTEAIQLIGDEIKNQINPYEKATQLSLWARWQALAKQPLESLQHIQQALLLLNEEKANDPLEVMSNATLVYSLAGQKAEALHWLEKALEKGGSVAEVERDPFLAGLRTDGRYRTLRDSYRKQDNGDSAK